MAKDIFVNELDGFRVLCLDGVNILYFPRPHARDALVELLTEQGGRFTCLTDLAPGESLADSHVRMQRAAEKAKILLGLQKYDQLQRGLKVKEGQVCTDTDVKLG
jgi:hypothetical protein